MKEPDPPLDPRDTAAHYRLQAAFSREQASIAPSVEMPAQLFAGAERFDEMVAKVEAGEAPPP